MTIAGSAGGDRRYAPPLGAAAANCRWLARVRISQQMWRDLMTKRLIPYVSELRRQGIEEGLAEGRVEGRVEGRAEDILRILGKRGIEVDEDSHDRIASCTDLDTLGTWLDRSLTAAQVGDLFA
jgi:hypothetical protein